MKKIFIILFIITLCILVGCIDEEKENPSKNGDDRFIGVWKSNISLTTITFFSDGTGSLGGWSITWKIMDNKLIIATPEKSGITVPYDYSFSNDNNILILTSVDGGTQEVFIKQ